MLSGMSKPDDIGAMAAWTARNLYVPAGHPAAGRPLVLPEFAISFLAEAVKHRISLLSTARKNAKSAIIAVYALAKLCPPSPIYEPGWRGGVASLTSNHSRELFLAIQDLAAAAGWHDRLHFRTSAPRRVEGPKGAVEFLSADKASGHAAGFSTAIIDEVGLMTERDRTLIGNMRTATLARGGRLIAISVYGTAPFSREISEAARDTPDVYAIRYSADDPECDLDDVEAIRQANPGIDAGIIDLDTLLSEARYAIRTPAEESSFRMLVLNQSVLSQRETLLTVGEFAGCMADNLPPRAGALFVGADRGESDSLSALFGYWPESGRCEYTALVGGGIALSARGARDDVDYSGALARGELIHDAGALVPDFGEFVESTLREWGHPQKLALDSYRKGDTTDVLRNAGLSESRVEWRRTGSFSNDQDIRAARRLVRSGRVKIARPAILLAENLGKTVVTSDRKNTLMIDKADRRHRIDLASAMILALGAADREPMPTGPLILRAADLA